VPGRPERRVIARPKRAARQKRVCTGACQLFEEVKTIESTEDRGDRSGRRRRQPALYPGTREGRSPLAFKR
jgi:hypothetical protein